MSAGYILLVDDDQLLRDSVARFLEDEGYEVGHATDGADAMEKVVTRPPHAILLDVMMPNMSGTEFLKRLRSDRQTANIPVVVITAVGGLVPATQNVEILNKPFDVNELLNKIALAVYRSRGSEEDEAV